MTKQIHFLVTMRKLDRRKLTPRDVILMWSVKTMPGIAGRDLAIKMGFPARSAIQFAIFRLAKLGLIEDRRIVLNTQTPNSLHITDLGEALLAEIVPAE